MPLGQPLAHRRHVATGSQSMFSGRKVVVTGGVFTQHIKRFERKSPFDILRDAVAYNAFHNSGARFNPPRCHPNTRVAVLDKLMDWVQRRDSETMENIVLWLTGAAGAGKSAIAQTFIELCLAHNLVTASFFFGRSDGGNPSNQATALIATLVYQIFNAVPPIQEQILSTIDEDPLIFTRSLDHQFDQLVARPLFNICASVNLWPLGTYGVILIDGLDECFDTEFRTQILQMIIHSAHHFGLPIRFLITSRPEYDISVAFRSLIKNNSIHRLYLDDTYNPDEDIRTFIKDNFEHIRTTHPLKALIPYPWPSPEAVESIIRKSSGQFIYAATVVLYVQSIRHRPHHRMEVIMKLRPAQGDFPFAQLDELYRMILSSAENRERVLYALSIYSFDVVDDPYLDVSKFMSLEDGELDILFCDLGSLVSIETITISNTGTEIKTLRILHASLHDFLLDPTRSKLYFLDINDYRAEHISNILHYVISDSGAVHDRAESVTSFFMENLLLCEGSTELIQRASVFPLTEILSRGMNNEVLDIQNFIYFTLLPSFRWMANLNERWSLVEKRQQDGLDQVILSQMPYYHSDDSLTALLCLVCHAGDENLVPGFRYGSSTPGATITDNWNLSGGSTTSRDTLLIEHINLAELATHNDAFRQCVIGFLQDPSRSGNFAIGPNTYPKAVLHFIQQVEDKLNIWVPFDEDHISTLLDYEQNAWILDLSRSQDKRPEFRMAAGIFLLLGYLIFFLPRSGKSASLLQQCRKPTFLTNLARHFPERTGLAREAMEEYLKLFKDNTFEEIHEPSTTPTEVLVVGPVEQALSVEIPKKNRRCSLSMLFRRKH